MYFFNLQTAEVATTIEPAVETTALNHQIMM